MQVPILLGVLCALIPLHQTSAQSTPSDTTVAAIDRIFDRFRGTTSPGCALGAGRNGAVLLTRAYGMANLETGTPIRVETVFHAASLAKQVTAMATLLLVRDGKLSLNDDIGRYLPYLPRYDRPITVRHLLTHTSGLRDYIELLILARGRFEEVRITRADLKDILARQRALNFSPGTAFGYSNTNYALLAEIIQQVTGESLKDIARTRIFAPLEMNETAFRDDLSALVAGRAMGHDERNGAWRLSVPNYEVYGPTNLLTTVPDFLRWLDNLGRPTVGDTAIVRLMTTRANLTNGDSVDYGLGLGITSFWGPRVVEHEGSDPGFRAYAGRWEKDGLSVVVLCNTRSVDAVRIGHDIAELYLGEVHRPTPPYPLVRSGHPMDSLEGKQYAGIYFQPERIEVLELSWRDGALYTRPRGGRRLLPVGPGRFQLEGFSLIYTFASGPRSDMVVTSLEPGHRPATFQWCAPGRAVPPSLANYAGEYFSPELNATYLVAADDSTLTLRTGSTEGTKFQAAFGDTFTAGQLTLEFVRKANRVNGFLLTHPRAIRVEFVRVEGRR